MKKYILLAIGILCCAGIASFIYFSGKSDVTYRTVAVTRGTIIATVSATGNLSAVTTVQVGTQVSGTIQKLYVDYNSRVKKGQTIAEIDPSLFRAAVEQALGNYLTAQANLQKARVTSMDADRTLTRNRKLLADGVVSQGDYDTAETSAMAARAAVKAAEGALSQTRGALMQARTNLKYSIIRSPVDGVVISRAVDVGQTVAASFQTPTLFTIAQDLTKMQIEVSVDEADISRIHENQNVTFSVDSYPEQPFRGRVVQIRNAPVITQNVVTYVVLVTVDNTDLRLKPGMTANVSIEVARKDGVLRVPLAALRFRPKERGEKTGNERPASGPRSDGAGRPGRRAGGQQVYTLRDRKPVAAPVKTGIANSSSVELVEGNLREGDAVIVEQLGGDTRKKATGGMGASQRMGPRF